MTELASFTCSHVFSAQRDVLLVIREEGDWMFMCGEEHESDEEYHLVGLNHLLDRDGSLREVLDLSEGFEAERSSKAGAWIRTEITASY